MKIAISSTEASLDAPIDEQFGRCPCFLIVDEEGSVSRVVDNPHADRGSGAGIQAARMLAESGVSTVLTGRCGPNACVALAAAGIAVVTGCNGTVRQALERFTAGKHRHSSAEDEKHTPSIKKSVGPFARASSARSAIEFSPRERGGMRRR
jgi:predicted Fe-Mo cluster-binding NifX family protein